MLADFEGPDYGSWAPTGDFAATTPHRGGDGRVGEQIVDTFFGNPNNGDPNTGSVVSPEFTINRDFLDFEIAGGNHPEPGPGQTAVNLVVDGAIVRTATGNDSGTLNWRPGTSRISRASGRIGAHASSGELLTGDGAARMKLTLTVLGLLIG